MKYVSINTIISKFYRETNDTSIEATDLIEWVGEAMDFLKVFGTQEQSVAFMEVKDHQASLPCGFQSILQVARDNQWSPCVLDEETDNICPVDVQEELPNEGVPIDCEGKIIGNFEVTYYRPYFDFKYFYNTWTNSSLFKNRFSLVRLSNHKFFNSVVCKESDHESLYHSCRDEYTVIAGDSGLRFSFKEGMVALAYLKTALDPETGYPLIPDNISLITAVSYYLKWKISEREMYSHREGSIGATDYNEKKWLKYVRQAKNYIKMPKTIDDYQDLLDITHQKIPNHRESYGFFGNLTK